MMRTSTITAFFQADIQTVWDTVTDNVHWQWRSDLADLKLSEDKKYFTEYTKNGFSTDFAITVFDPCHIYGFTMNNKTMAGRWQGTFSAASGGETKIVFTEEIEIKNPLMRIASYLFMNLKKMQETYIRDLGKQLGCSYRVV